ncbi:AAA family ATPase, partial [Methylovulum psychrotolerans]
MLKRLYIHNYKCLVNFEINFDKDISLFLGANGSGKSTVFEVLDKLRRVIFYQKIYDKNLHAEVNKDGVENIFNHTDQPRWLRNEKIDTHFQLDIKIQESVYRYSLIISLGHIIDHDEEIPSVIKEESLYCNDEVLVQSNAEKTLYFSNLWGETEYSLDKSTSSIQKYCSFYSKEFGQYSRNLFFVRINPYLMSSWVMNQDIELERDSSNFAEWLAHLNEANRKGIAAFENAMKQIIPEYDHFGIAPLSGVRKILRIEFKNLINKNTIRYDFDELSEGQKALFALYALIYCTPENSLICIDEPENFLALPEIQPWFDTLYD